MTQISHKAKEQGAKSNKSRKRVKVITQRKTIPESKKVEILRAKYKEIDESAIKKFTDFPLSERTLRGLKECNYLVPAEIQKQCIGKALQGYDILGAAKTGSGKTLAFLIPVLELLYCELWTRDDHLGALIITPTRELALQIFETLRKIGKYHDFSAGLIIGGKDLKFERTRLEHCNIVIGTPGRILHHMDKNATFDTSSLKILVLDEADRCLDLKFQHDIDAIIDHLPKKRQTLLFSATQTKSVKDLARLNLSKDRQYISIHEHTKYVTPENLKQSYTVCNLNEKVSMLWSFIKRHPRQKIIVFLSTCKQTKYMYECFCKLRPGIPITALYGKMHQLRRMKIYEKFCSTKKAALFCTDIASRGLDFPGVHWVIQMDCPESTDQYIHRVGRTARFSSDGQSLLVLTPSELKMVDKLIAKKIPINKVKIDAKYLISPHRKLESFLARDIELKESAKRAFISYLRSITLMKDKEVFNVHSLDVDCTDAFAISLGLVPPRRIRFLEKLQNHQKQQNESSETENTLPAIEKSNHNSKEDNDDDDDDDDDDNDDEDEDEDDDDDNEDEKRQENIGKNKKFSTKNDHSKNVLGNNCFTNDDSDDELLKIKQKNVQIEDGDSDEFTEDFPQKTSKKKKVITKAAVAKKILHKKIIPNKKIMFDEEGKEVIDPTKSIVSELAKEHENDEFSGIDIELSKKILREEDKVDKQLFKEKVKEKHREEKRKRKAQMNKKNDEDEDDDDEIETSNFGRNRRKVVNSSESENDSDGPDLSWLSDPDKLYGPKKDTSNDEDSESDQAIHRPPKRKLLTHDDQKAKRPKLKVPKNSDLLATEELALQLLQN